MAAVQVPSYRRIAVWGNVRGLEPSSENVKAALKSGKYEPPPVHHFRPVLSHPVRI